MNNKQFKLNIEAEAYAHLYNITMEKLKEQLKEYFKNEE